MDKMEQIVLDALDLYKKKMALEAYAGYLNNLDARMQLFQDCYTQVCIEVFTHE